MAEERPIRRRFWTWCRCSFRWFRIAILTLILFSLALLTWLRLGGLPRFISVRLADELARRGVAANIKSLRFHWFRGFVAEDLRVSWGGPNGPRITIAEADIDVAPPPWRNREEMLRGLTILRGSFVMPLLVTNEPPSELRIHDLSANIRFLPGDAWDVQRVAATAFGLQLELRASLTNVAGLRRAPRPTDPAVFDHRVRLLRSAVEELNKWSTPTPPRLEVYLALDGLQPAAVQGGAYLTVPRVKTPRGELRHLKFSLRSQSPGLATEGVPVTAVFELDELQTADGGLSGLTGRLDLRGSPRPAIPSNAVWQVNIREVFLRGLRARNVDLRGTNELLSVPTGASAAELAATPVRTRLLAQAADFAIANVSGSPFACSNSSVFIDATHGWSTEPPKSATFTAVLGSGRGDPGSLHSVRLQGELHQRQDPGMTPAELGGWSWLWPMAGRLDLEANQAESTRLRLERLRLEAEWEPPRLTLNRLEAALLDGELRSHGSLDVVSRAVTVTAETTFDLHGLDGFLGPRSRENVARYQWQEAPWFQGTATAVLPPWTERNPDWKGEVKPTLELNGHFRVKGGSFKGVPFDTAASSVAYDGATWRLPDLHTTRPEGEQRIAVEYNEETREYHVDARGLVVPPILKPLLGSSAGEVLDLFNFGQPVAAEASVWGPWTEATKEGVLGTIRATNLTFRGQRFDRLEATVDYTNRVLVVSPLRLARDEGELHADGIVYQITDDRVSISNAVNTIEPAVVAAVIGPDLPEKIAPYRFERPPTVHVEGTLQTRDTSTADLRFRIEGGPFRFWRLSATEIQTGLHWHGPHLILSDIDAHFYQGTLRGDAAFDLSNPADGLYRFNAEVRDAHLGDLLREVSLPRIRTNVAEGVFNLDLHVTSARTSDLNTWNGHGHIDLRDGLLWDVPIFGFLSPVLNGIVPGIGNNKAERADATFTMTNSVIHTRDLTIACPPARLLYRGSVDFEQRVDAKVEGQILSEVAGFGPLFGLLLRPLTKFLEFRVTGTLVDFNVEPLYILPKLLLLPLQPMKLLRGLFGVERPVSGSSTNNPIEAPPP